MKHMVIVLAGLGLAACGGSSPSAEDICNQMIEGDPEAAREISQDGIEPAAMCACVGSTIEAKSEADQAKLLNVMKEIIAIRKAEDVGVEDAASALQDQLEEGTKTFEFNEADWRATGRLLNDVSNQLEEGGSCETG